MAGQGEDGRELVRRRLAGWSASAQAQADANSGRVVRAGTGIELRARAWADAPRNIPLPQLVIDGAPPLMARWGTTFHAAPAGGHSIMVFHRLMYRWRGSIAMADVEVPDTAVLVIEYRASWPAFRPGTMRSQPASPS